MCYNIIIAFCFWSILGIALLFNITIISAQSNATMTVGANIIGFRNNYSYEGIGIQVPDFIDLGNVTTDDPVSKEKTIYINNTGSVDIIVTPQLSDSNEGIFNYLFFRSYKQSPDSEKNKYYRIGDYSLNISKPSTGSTVRKAQCYMSLNLTDFNAPISHDLIGHQAEITFWAMPA